MVIRPGYCASRFQSARVPRREREAVCRLSPISKERARERERGEKRLKGVGALRAILQREATLFRILWRSLA